MISLNLVKGTGLENIAARNFHLDDHILHLSQIAFCHHQQEIHDYNERERERERGCISDVVYKEYQYNCR